MTSMINDSDDEVMASGPWSLNHSTLAVVRHLEVFILSASRENLMVG